MPRRRITRGKVRPLRTRIQEKRDQLDKLELQDKISELRARVKRTGKGRR